MRREEASKRELQPTKILHGDSQKVGPGGPITAPEWERPCECRTTLGTLTVDWGIRSVFRGKLRQRVIGYVEVGRDILDIIMIIQGFHQFQHLAAGIRV